MKEITIKMNKKNVLIGNYIPYGPLYTFLHNKVTTVANEKFATKNTVIGIIANEFVITKKNAATFEFDCCMQTDHYEGNTSWMEDDWLRVTVLR